MFMVVKSVIFSQDLHFSQDLQLMVIHGHHVWHANAMIGEPKMISLSIGLTLSELYSPSVLQTLEILSYLEQCDSMIK